MASDYDPRQERLELLEFARIRDVDLLDIGAGQGLLTLLAAGTRNCTVTCIDLDPVKLENARKIITKAGISENVFFEQQDARRLSYPAGHFSCVACYSVLHHVPFEDRDQVVAEAVRVARQNVAFAEITETCARYFDEVLHPAENHQDVVVDQMWLRHHLESFGKVEVMNKKYTYYLVLVKNDLKSRQTRDLKEKEKIFEEFAKISQEEIVNQELKDYNERIIELFHDPPNWGKIEGNDIISHSYLGPCGDKMTFFLRINKGIVQKACFTTTGCGASVATGAQTTLLLDGKRITDAAKIDAEMIDKALGGLPKDHKHCAELASRTLHQLLKKYAFRHAPQEHSS